MYGVSVLTLIYVETLRGSRKCGFAGVGVFGSRPVREHGQLVMT